MYIYPSIFERVFKFPNRKLRNPFKNARINVHVCLIVKHIFERVFELPVKR